MLILNSQQRQAILDHAKRESPRECCGVLIGSVSIARHTVVEVIACANASPAPQTRYELLIKDLIASQKRARDLGLAVIGFYHSHPESRPEPSATDLREAYWVGSSYVIVGRIESEAHFRSFLLRQKGTDGDRYFEEEEIFPA
jgi:proteasome lid subunit RPN8/RPN11